MALSLTLYPDQKDNDFFIDGVQVIATGKIGIGECDLEVRDVITRKYHLTPYEAIEIMPNVRVYGGSSERETKGVKLNIEAPRNIIVKRGKLYRESNSALV